MSDPNIPTEPPDPIRRGFGLKDQVRAERREAYYSPLIEKIRQAGNRWRIGGIELRLAREFGFCYGVDKAIDFAYETHRRFPDRRIFLTTEIIHNPRVNQRLIEMGVHFLGGQYAGRYGIEDVTAEDVVFLPAFGYEVQLLERLRGIGCITVDGTCGSVVHVWKRVERYAREGLTSIIHGKWRHEETVATASHVAAEGGKYLVIFDEPEATMVCDFIRTGEGSQLLAEKFRRAMSPDFDFSRDLERIGVANQTTMLSSESLAIAGMLRSALEARYGSEGIEDRFRMFETICTATQERQDAVQEMMADPPDLMLIVGGFNSSNTGHLCEIAAHHCPSYHIEEVDCLISPERIRHKPAGGGAAIETKGWLPARRPLSIGITAGASTPNRVVGEVIERLASWEEK
ncbi:4-hydroxy-3-methylbut-2-enyl diphosphate reductase [bacterium]|nr:4-hydroxy-3-methylbut-2-enyl diphosphate reductase [bacterium]